MAEAVIGAGRSGGMDELPGVVKARHIASFLSNDFFGRCCKESNLFFRMPLLSPFACRSYLAQFMDKAIRLPRRIGASICARRAFPDALKQLDPSRSKMPFGGLYPG